MTREQELAQAIENYIVLADENGQRVNTPTTICDKAAGYGGLWERLHDPKHSIRQPTFEKVMKWLEEQTALLKKK